MATVDLTTATFGDTVSKNGIVLVDYWAEWCRPCKQFGPIFEAASERHPDVTFAKVDTEAEQQIGAQLEITSIPTVMAFRDGVLVFRQPGAMPGNMLDDVIKAIQELDMDQVRADMAAKKG